MATFPATFGSDSARIHGDHQLLAHELLELEGALDELVCGCQVFANLHSAQRIGHHGRRLAVLLPEHFRREEATLLSTVARVSPELDEFARQMRQQHAQLSRRLAEFCRVIERLEGGDDVAETVSAVKRSGKLLAREIASHMALEENQLGGFL